MVLHERALAVRLRRPLLLHTGGSDGQGDVDRKYRWCRGRGLQAGVSVLQDAGWTKGGLPLLEASWRALRGPAAIVDKPAMIGKNWIRLTVDSISMSP